MEGVSFRLGGVCFVSRRKDLPQRNESARPQVLLPCLCLLHRTWSVDPERSRRFDPTPWRERHSVSQRELTAYPTPHSFVLFVFYIFMEHDNI